MIGVSRDANPVQVNRILREVYSHEKRFRASNAPCRNFAIPSPQKLRQKIVSGPPHRINFIYKGHTSSPSSNDAPALYHPEPIVGSLESFGDDLLSTVSSESCCSSMEGGLHYPVDVPLTSSKSIGWIVRPELESSQRWRKPRITGSVVKYAEIYYEQNRINPFKHGPK
jgi:hypothetical protein